MLKVYQFLDGFKMGVDFNNAADLGLYFRKIYPDI